MSTYQSTFTASTNDTFQVTSLFRQLLRVHNTVFRLSFTNMPSDPDHGISANKCWPSTLVDDPGFALINEGETGLYATKESSDPT